MNLSSAQIQIVEAPIGQPIQVLASAGSGKTRVLTERVRYLLEKTTKDGVIALTFTNKAAEEMNSRLIDFCDVNDRVWVATIHSVAQRILEKYGHTIGLPSELHIYDKEKDRLDVFIQSLRDDGIHIDSYLDNSNSKDREKKLNTFLSIFSKIKRELLTEFEISELYPDNNIWKIYQDYQSVLLNSGGIDYDDILVYAHQILLTHDWIAKVYRSQYRHICIDEAQDLNKVQYEFIKALCGDAIKSVLMVGDPNQMIYGFNGSSKDYLCSHFICDFNPQKFELKENYRSSKAIVRVANKLRPESQAVINYALEGIVSITECDTEENEATAIITTIKELLALKTHDEIEGEISLYNMVVIARNRFVFSKLEKYLNDSLIPYSLRKGERQLEPSTQIGQILEYAIRVKLNPKDWVAGKKLCHVLNINEPASWAGKVLLDMSIQISSSGSEFSEIFIKLLQAISNLSIDNPNILKLVKECNTLLTSLVENPCEVSDEVAENIKLNIEELKEFSDTWTRFKRKGLGDSLVAFRNALALGELNENSEDTGLILSTVHTMKGLERDIVLLMGMCEGVFPDYRATTKEKLEEERNNAFVAVTRAKRWLFVYYPKQRMMPWGNIRLSSKSRFIKEIESECL